MNIPAVAGIGLISVADRIARQVLAIPSQLLNRRVTPSAAKDSAAFSDMARLLAMKQYDPQPSPAVRPVALRDAYAGNPAVQANLAAFALQLGKLFSDNGVDMSREIVLAIDPSGRIIVSNDHPDRAVIEQLIATGALTEQYRQLAAQATAMRPGTLPQLHLMAADDAFRAFFTSA